MQTLIAFFFWPPAVGSSMSKLLSFAIFNSFQKKTLLFFCGGIGTSFELILVAWFSSQLFAGSLIIAGSVHTFLERCLHPSSSLLWSYLLFIIWHMRSLTARRRSCRITRVPPAIGFSGISRRAEAQIPDFNWKSRPRPQKVIAFFWHRRWDVDDFDIQSFQHSNLIRIWLPPLIESSSWNRSAHVFAQAAVCSGNNVLANFVSQKQFEKFPK